MNYPLSYGEHAINHFTRRSAAEKARFLIPYLREDFHLLDCGCGPGSITVDFAEILKSGHVTGVDFDSQQFQWGQNEAHKRGIQNLSFYEGDIHALPFEDHTFDVVFTHAVLWTTPRPAIALHEMKRVLKPGGIIACREIDRRSFSIHPASSILFKGFELQTQGLLASGAHCFLGSELKELFKKAGLKNIQASLATDYFDKQEDLSDIAVYFIKNWTNSPWAEKVRFLRLASDEEIEAIKKSWQKWGGHPEAHVSGTFGEAIGFKP